MVDATAYEDLDRQDLVERLIAAETVCVVTAWCQARTPVSDREAAAVQAWREWVALAGDGFIEPAAHGGIDRVVGPLLQRRHVAHAATGARRG